MGASGVAAFLLESILDVSVGLACVDGGEQVVRFRWVAHSPA